MPLLGWAAATALSGDGDGGGTSASTDSETGAAARDASGEATTDSTAGSYEVAQATRSAIDACATRLAAGRAMITASDTGIDHWNEHIQARTDMLAGLLTQDEMRAIWKRTRLAGPDDVSRATAALEEFRALPACEGLADAEGPESLVEQAQACLAREPSVDAAVDAAAAAISDWANHLNAMVAHAEGAMDAAEAQDLWVAAWEAAPTNIGGYNDARDVLAQAPSCD